MTIVAFIVGMVIGICTASSCWKKAVHKTIVEIKDEERDKRLRQLAQVKIDLDRQREELEELDKKQIGKDTWERHTTT